MKTALTLCFLFFANLSFSQTDSLIITGTLSDLDDRIPTQVIGYLSSHLLTEQTFSYDSLSGAFELHVRLNDTGIETRNPSIPAHFYLSQPSNNPGGQGSSGPTLYLDLAQNSDLDVTIYNIMGQRIAQISSPALQPGSYRISWDGKQSDGTRLSAGLYFIQISGHSASGKPFRLTRKYTLLDGNIAGQNFIRPAQIVSNSVLGKGAVAASVDTLIFTSPGFFTLADAVELTTTTGALELGTIRLDRRSLFLGSLEPQYAMTGGERLAVKIPAIDADDKYELTVTGDYAEIVGDTLVFTPSVEASADMPFTLLLSERPYDSQTPVVCDSLQTALRVTQANMAPVILHRNYFTDHPAYLMAGQTNTDSSYALPLDGIEKLATGPLLYDANGDSLVKELNVSDTDMIGAFIDGNNVLRIFGKDASKTGMGYVDLKVSDPSGKYDSIQIPVVVFGRDRTLMVDGKKKYYVPWSPELDVNRITSVEQFLVDEGYQEEALDRSINFSRWKLMKYMRDVEFVKDWLNEHVQEGWTWEAQKILIDYTLDELKFNNVDFIRVRNCYFMETINSNELIKLYEPGDINWKSVTWISKRDYETKYIINQAHNKGMGVLIGPMLADVDFHANRIVPTDWSTWFDSYGYVVTHLAEIAHETGMDILRLGEAMVNITGTVSDEQWGDYFRDRVIKPAKEVYSGPMAYLDNMIFYEMYAQWDKIKIWNDLDIIGSGPPTVGPQLQPITNSLNPTYSEIYNGMHTNFEELILKFNELVDKPLILFENGLPSIDGVFKYSTDFERWLTLPFDPTEQELFYKVSFNLMQDLKKDWFFGFGWYGFEFLPASGGINNTHLTARGKPAEDVMRFYYGDGDTKKWPIQNDGQFDDWKPEFLLATDSIGDSKTPEYDLKAVYGTKDEVFFYLMVEFDGGLRDNIDNIAVYIDVNNDNQPDYPLGIFGGGNPWLAGISENMAWQGSKGLFYASTDSTRSKFEVKIPFRALDYPNSIQFIRLESYNNVDFQMNDVIDAIMRP